MENYQFESQDTLSQSEQSTFEYKYELLQQFQFVQNETLMFINIEESDQEVDITKQKQVKTQLFFRRTSIKESQDRSSQINEINPNQPKIKKPEQQIQESKQMITQQIKRSMKRSQTAFKKEFGSFAKQNGSKIFLKRANQAIVNNFEQIRKQKSIITNNINQFGKSHLRTIQVKYFRTNLTKVLFIEKEMTAIEFIVLALKEYTLERKFDQNLFEYKNYTLAYQLETLEDQFEIDEDRFRRPIQRAKSVIQKEEDNIAVRRASCNERAIAFLVEHSFSDYEDKTITIDFPVVLSCKQVDIVVNQTCQQTFGVDLQTLKKTYEQFPEYIILLIEDAQTQSKLQIKCLNNSRLEDVLDSFNNGFKSKRSLKDYFLRLKYPCIHTGIGPLSLSTPVNQLPIHWLVLEKKYIIEYQTPNLIDLGRKFENFKQTNYYEDGFISCSQQDSQMKMESINYLSSLYSYQEFQLMQLKKGQQQQVLIGIDYFDIRIFYINHQNNIFSHSSLLQYIPNYIVDMFKCKKKEEKIIKIKSIKLCSLDQKQNKFYFTYKNSVSKFKQLCFIPEQSNDKRSQTKLNNQFLESYQKLDNLVGLRKNHIQIDENLK
ncbi:unnamed protein product [Paramecium octaurelia]|uniref:Uncharacterized protein n=1 Tax=Paramecium octaurelia TaxID=43137 RepID=A0A8S1U5U7_PAROT|nr:unnamed protein product [Paramecium octaurelia]